MTRITLFVGDDATNKVMGAADLNDNGAKVFGKFINVDVTKAPDDLKKLLVSCEGATIYAVHCVNKVVIKEGVKMLSDGKRFMFADELGSL